MLNKTIRFFLENKIITVILFLLLIFWGISSAPFNWQLGALPRDPVPVDAIPDIGENQQIVFTNWPGRSPQDVEDQITYPLTSALLGIPGVKSVRSSSMFGSSSIYIIFNEEVEFYWSRSRTLERLNSLPSGTLPSGVTPVLGPDATALGQVFWYTLEGRDEDGNASGGWDPQELRSIQDYTVKYALASTEGVSEVASIGGFIKEYQIDLDPVAMKANNIGIPEVVKSIEQSNIDIGARTLEVNRVEYLVRGLGYIRSIEDLENSVVSVNDNVPIRIKDVARVSMGPAPRRGALDKGGAEAVGGVVVARYGANPLEVINNIKKRIAELADGLPEIVLDDGTISKIQIVPFYDRSELINETLGTLEEALSLEVLITIIVVILMVMELRVSLVISSMLPVAVLMSFIAMKQFGVDANIVALSGIAIAIGTMVDVGIVISENILRHLREAGPNEDKLEVIYRGTTEVSSAVITAVATTVISFLPVFTMIAAEGKLFRPLAFTKSFALVSSIIVVIVFLPTLMHWVFSIRISKKIIKRILGIIVLVGGAILLFKIFWLGLLLVAAGITSVKDLFIKGLSTKVSERINVFIYASVIIWLLSYRWLPLGPHYSAFANFIFVATLIGVILFAFNVFIRFYPSILAWCLKNKKTFLAIPLIIMVWGLLAWKGVPGTSGKSDKDEKTRNGMARFAELFPGIEKEFMPSLDEGSFLLMPTTMPHSGMEENLEVLAQLDMAVSAIPEVESVVGKMGRADSPFDPAPISMFENVINYKSEYITNENGERLRFRTDDEGNYEYDDHGELILDKRGKYFRNWRDHINSPNDIWNKIAKIRLPGVTAAPKLQPIETRLIMLQTGMRAPMGIKVYGSHLDTIQKFGEELERFLKDVPEVKAEAVFADRIVGKPYLQIDLDRIAIGRFGLTIGEVQSYLEVAIGGVTNTRTVEGRERYPVRVRYPRELRGDPYSIDQILIPTKSGAQIPLGQLASIEYVRGPQVIKSEDTFLTGYVLFDKKDEFAEGQVVEAAQQKISDAIDSGQLRVPHGIRYKFAGNYENQIRAENRLLIVMPIALALIFLILYLQFRSVAVTSMIFSAILVAFSGGFIMLWLYGLPGFLNFEMFGTDLRDLFQIHKINLSVAVWVGFIALFGIATDDGVVIATYLSQQFKKKKMQTELEIRQAVIIAGTRRVRPCLMTTATTLLALLPILTSTGRGSDIMVPMAIPSFGGMTIALITLFIVPVLYSAWQERMLKNGTVS